ncbi:MAG: DUF748 domain-containing protein [Opitutus sp.]
MANPIPSGAPSSTRPVSAIAGTYHKHCRPGHPAKRRWLIALGVIVGVLLLVQLVASPIATSIVNRKLTRLPGFAGHADSIKIALWRGAVELKEFNLSEIGFEGDAPLVHIKKATMKVAPSALFRAKLGGSALVDGLDINIIKRGPAPAPEEAKNKVEEVKEKVQHWQDVLRNAFPVTLTRLEVKNSQFKFIDRSHQPNVDVGIHNLHIVATDLQNRPKENGDPLPSRVDVTGVTTGEGQLKVGLRLDPIAKQPRFAMNLEVVDQQLPPLNSFLLAYTDADVSRGTFEVFSEINAQNGAYDGYIKPMMHDLDFRNPSDKDKSLGKQIKEKVVSAVTSLLKNDDNQQVATRAPFAGNFADNQVDIWTTVVNLLRNAFVQAIRGGLEGQTPRG